eukprot:gene7239-8416_t
MTLGSNLIGSLLLACLIIATVSAQTCQTAASVEYRTSGKNLLIQGQPLQVQGITWFGLETENNSPGGLQQRSVESLLDTLVAQKFNVLRIPFSVEMLLNQRFPTAINYGINPGLQGKDAVGVLEYIVAACANRGILVCLEQHRFNNADYISGLWYEGPYTEQVSINTWISLVTRLKTYWNIWALDIKNEPHGLASWGSGDLSTDWDAAFVRMSNAIGAACPWFNGVYMVQGIEDNKNAACSYEVGNWWGGNLSPANCFPITGLVQPNRLVYSPHAFCSSVYDQPYFNVGNYPSNMAEIWDQHFGFLATTRNRPVVLGEWGCRNNNNKNAIWMDTFTKYLNARGIVNHIYFGLNPDSLDTDSILNADWNSINTNTMTKLAQIGVVPTRITRTGTQICTNQVWSSSSSTTSPITTTTTAPASTTGPASSTTTAPASTTTTAPASTTTTTTTPATTGQATTAPATTTGSSTTTPSTTTTTGSTTSPSQFSISQTSTSSWTEGGFTWTVYSSYVTNNGAQVAYAALIPASGSILPTESWGAFTSGASRWEPQTWALPINPNQAMSFGYKIKSGSPISFTVTLLQ